MANNDISIHTVDRGGVRTPGIARLLVAVAGISDAGSKWGKETAERASMFAAERMRMLAPRGDEPDFPANAKVHPAHRRGRRPKLHQRVGYERNARWFPGGAGGGGTWQAQAGVRSVGIRPITHDPAWIVYHGSGRRGDSFASGSNIYSKPPGNVMTFMYGGVQVFAHRVGGQRAQTLWVEEAQRRARQEVRRRMAELGRTLR